MDDEVISTGVPRPRKNERYFVEVDKGTQLDNIILKELNARKLPLERISVLCDDKKTREMYEPGWEFTKVLNKAGRASDVSFAIWSKYGDGVACRLITYGKKRTEEIKSYGL